MNADALPSDFLALAFVVLLLGIKHGFDADHLAAIDALTRCNARARPQLARRAGALFCLGHGAVVMAVATMASVLAQQWQAPAWLGPTGACLSIGVLSVLAAINVRSAVVAPAGQTAALVGWRSSALAPLLKAANAPTVLAVGMLFALSLDTLSLATLFALAGTRHGGWGSAAALAGLFFVGMLLTDGINGWWISRLLQRADGAAEVASRTMALAVSAVALLTAGVGVARLSWPDFDDWAAGKAGWFGAGVIVLVAASYALGRLLARRSRTARQGTGRVVGSAAG